MGTLGTCVTRRTNFKNFQVMKTWIVTIKANIFSYVSLSRISVQQCTSSRAISGTYPIIIMCWPKCIALTALIRGRNVPAWKDHTAIWTYNKIWKIRLKSHITQSAPQYSLIYFIYKKHVQGKFVAYMRALLHDAETGTKSAAFPHTPCQSSAFAKFHDSSCSVGCGSDHRLNGH
jgi:hypothetical protein